ncbi:DNA polymerase IV [Thioclava sp. SK-1]|uniref:DNA polymerase IV n=1 Tax=Thioclava sp. SK-1 TaxID=1889770 RepID=UPI000826D6D9|nr:DNA polymerase IV [Thioclava sp. SK-1]OCX65855.1 DNA polymerase IV [Thioclava sp. SK-1]
MTGPAPDTRRILHIDMDAFFASVEQRDDPRLRGKPVAVGGNRARGVVAAASYEARRFGVKSAMPSVTAARRCPELIFVPPKFDTYRSVSDQIRAIFLEYTDLVEPLSLDEAYLDVSAACAQGTTATAIAQDIRRRIFQDVQLTASAGVSVNKFLAKLASDQDKPDGLTVIRPHQVADFVAGLSVSRFHGVGPVTEAKMKALGIVTGADLRTWALADLARNFGSSAEHYWRIARGIDTRPVQPNRERKSIGAEQTFETDITALPDACAALQQISDKVAQRAAQKHMRGHTITVKVKFNDFQQITRQVTLRTPTRESAEIMQIAGKLMADIFPCRPMRLLGISLSSLLDDAQMAAPVQPSLFDLPPGDWA